MRDRTFLIWVGLGAILLALLNLPVPLARQAKAAVREGLAPLHSLLSGFSLRVREAGGTLRGLGGLVGKNRELETEIVRLRHEVQSLQAYGRENVGLREALGFRMRATQRLIPCEVIARDASGWWQTVRLGHGEHDGIAADRAVVTADGLAGRTVEVSAHTCDVLLLSDPNCRISVRIARTGSNGVLTGEGVRWNGQVSCRMDFINRNHPVRPGDEVVTSGLGGVFPPDLLVGYVESVDLDASGLYRRAEVLPRADLGMMNHAFVLAGDAGAASGPVGAPAIRRAAAPGRGP